MAKIQKNNEVENTESKIDSWFSSIIDHIKVDHLLISTNTATSEKKEFYQDLINGETTSLIGKMRDNSTQYFITHILQDYIYELKTINKFPLKLAMGLSDSKLLVWSEINDDDEEMEDALLNAEAKVNGKYIKNGFFINSTIIEKSDKLPIPPHYQTLIS